MVARRTPIPNVRGEFEPLTPEQRAAVDAWERSGRIDSPEVAALRKRIRGETVTAEESARLASATRKPEGSSVPHARIEELVEERRRRGG
jgi:hypothetical protein